MRNLPGLEHLGRGSGPDRERVRPKARPPLSDGKPIPLSDVDSSDHPRAPTGLEELDTLLGGGLVPGGSYLIGGEPGIGKSTLLLQLCGAMAASGKNGLYVTGEESTQQVKLRADRLEAAHKKILLAVETDAEMIANLIEKEKPALAVIDSIQTCVFGPLGGAPGSVGQVRESAARIIHAAKRVSVPAMLVGHVTKDGSIAGPKTLEHMVDAVLYFEGDRFANHRVLRSIKNRYGSTNELGIFEMTSEGLLPVKDPSRLFLSEHPGERIGSAVTAVAEGNRVFLVEIQALTSNAHYGTPERRATGVDRNRLGMILAVLERRAGLNLAGQDVFVNAVGGLSVEEPAADLAIALAVASNFLDRPLPEKTVAFGELGLSGEIRPAPRSEMRLKEAKRLGFASSVDASTLRDAIARLTPCWRGPSSTGLMDPIPGHFVLSAAAFPVFTAGSIPSRSAVARTAAPLGAGVPPTSWNGSTTMPISRAPTSYGYRPLAKRR